MQIDSGDTAWVLVSTALVLFMTPGLALFYGGMVRSKSVLAIMAQVFGVIAVVSIVWALVAYSLAFGPDIGGGLLGDLKFAGLAHPRDAVPGLDLSVPPIAFAAFQMMFAVITAALIAGAGADRMRFGAFLLFAGVWCVLVYAPIAHWVFSPNGWLASRGVLDFAGGVAVEINSGASALALAIVVGRRQGWPRTVIAPHSLPLTLVGAGILWFGWFGFNAGSALASGDLAAQALMSTHLAACGGLLGWMALEKIRTGHATTLGAATGSIAGLVAITPAAGFLNSVSATVLGLVAGAVAALAVEVKFRLGYDDSLDVVAVHGVCGVVGMIGVGLFASQSVNPAIAYTGLTDGGGVDLLGRQLLAIGVGIVWAFGLSYVIAKVIDRTIGMRVPREIEVDGLDTHLHAESAYDFGATHAAGRIGA